MIEFEFVLKSIQLLYLFNKMFFKEHLKYIKEYQLLEMF